MHKVSIIIGLYNVSAFLMGKKLSCILQQTYPNIEIILVNDGSTDDTLFICKELAATDSRIIIINNEKNEGLGNARNIGLNVATGEFIWFYDVDDEAEVTLIEKNVRWMQKYQVDFIVFSYKCNTPYLCLTQNVCFKERLIESNQSLKDIFIDELLIVPNGNGFAWNKFYRKSFIDKHQFRFENLRIQQDEVFNLQFYPKLSRVYMSSELLYHYYIYETGNTRTRFIKNRYDIYLYIFRYLLSFSKQWNLADEKLITYIYWRFYSGIENTILFNTFHPCSNYTFREKAREVHKILSQTPTKQCIRYIQKQPRLGLEQSFFLFMYCKDSFIGIVVLRKIFRVLRRIKYYFSEKPQ